jgi:hypothetical protein
LGNVDGHRFGVVDNKLEFILREFTKKSTVLEHISFFVVDTLLVVLDYLGKMIDL